MNKIVSIITPTYNSEKYIEKTIKSVLNQTYSNWELLLIDDCSSDSTISIINKYLNDERIKLFKNKENKGAAVSRNTGIERSRGDFIAFLDSDDFWEKEKLEKQLYFMKEKNCEISFTAFNIILDDNEIIKSTKVKSKVNYKQLLKCNYIFCSTVVINKKKFNKIEMPLIRRRQDWGLWLKLLRESGGVALGINEVLCNYRKSDGSLSSNKLKLLEYNYTIYNKVLGYSKVKSLYFFFRFFVYHFFKKIIY